MKSTPSLRPEQSKPLSEGLADLQTSVERVLGTITDDAMAAEVAGILHEISTLRLNVDLPGEGDRRKDLREPRCDISIFKIDGQNVDCAIQDLSIGGAHIVADLPVAPNTEIALNIPEAGAVTARVVRQTDTGVHVQFEALTDPQIIAITESLQAHYTK
ncbi:PilZ domain-containing protein [Nisaea acidiphila]|uniref:PilZ domain-containing protein n=1 Tax=Nisaea acidiphila TaxID=1862145 RepID=A0A9J7AWF9_9PROT|nr:PilZ domain-containing protein [Nisaea acidiphila]UUX49773.1 PilZ domain-containing protein [Nisaea acidiphila]